MWTGGSQAPAPSSSQSIKDPRDLRNRALQAKMRQDVVTWLQITGFDAPSNFLQSITGKDYGAVFQHLVRLLDPAWPFNPEQKWEHQFLPPLQALRYPYSQGLDLKWLPTPAAPHSWPSLLAVLHWLVEMGKVDQNEFSTAMS